MAKQLMLLAVATAEIRISYAAGWRAVTAGKVRGAERRGRSWYVDPDALREATK